MDDYSKGLNHPNIINSIWWLHALRLGNRAQKQKALLFCLSNYEHWNKLRH